MENIFEFCIDENNSVLAELTNTGYKEEFVSSDSLIKKASIAFEKSLYPIKAVSQSIIRQFDSIEKPQEIEIEFGLKLQAETSAIVATVGGECNINVKLKWINNK